MQLVRMSLGVSGLEFSGRTTLLLCPLLAMRSVAASKRVTECMSEDGRVMCIICSSCHGDPHPAFAGESLQWAEYYTVAKRRRVSRSESGGGPASSWEGEDRQPSGLLCDVCNRTLPLWREQYWRTPVRVIAGTAHIRKEFLSKRDEYIETIRANKVD
jgi:hypothetical protein